MYIYMVYSRLTLTDRQCSFPGSVGKTDDKEKMQHGHLVRKIQEWHDTDEALVAWCLKSGLPVVQIRMVGVVEGESMQAQVVFSHHTRIGGQAYKHFAKCVAQASQTTTIATMARTKCLVIVNKLELKYETSGQPDQQWLVLVPMSALEE